MKLTLELTNEEADFIKDQLWNAFMKYIEKTRTNKTGRSLETPRQNEIWWRATLYQKIWSQHQMSYSKI
jgi:hypothetical protein